MARHELAHRFLAALPEALRARQPDPDALESQLRAALQQAVASWPAVTLPAASFVEHSASVLARPENAEQSLGDLHLEDLYLARASATGDQAAIAAAEASWSEEVTHALSRVGVSPDLGDEVRQRLRERLFLPSSGGEPPAILTYSGRGRLGAFVRVVAVRIALMWFRAERRLQQLDTGEDLARHIDPANLTDSGPEQAHLRELYTREFKAALARAVASLEDKERQILRQHLLAGLTIDDLGSLYGVHRATAARWVERARRALTTGVRRIMREQLRIEETTLESVLRLIDSRIDLSIPKLL